MMKYPLIFLSICIPALAQEHEHGVGEIPDWYDSDCCNRRDCHPVPDNQIDFDTDEQGGPVVIHRYDLNELPIVYEKTRWRQSKDERYHACYFKDTKGQITRFCIYLRVGI
jgi:hypothetical protein